MKKKYDLGVVPHYIDKRGRKAAIDLGLPIIDPLRRDPLEVVDEIRQCHSIVSSSLHGIIVAHAYGIPAAWLACNRLCGDGVKFEDHGQAVGLEIRSTRSILDAKPEAPSSVDTQPLTEALAEVIALWEQQEIL